MLICTRFSAHLKTSSFDPVPILNRHFDRGAAPFPLSDCLSCRNLSAPPALTTCANAEGAKGVGS